MSIISQELDYQKRNFSHPTYTYTKLTQQTGGQTITPQAASNVESIFELPPKVFNLSKSILSFTFTPPAPGANTFNKYFCDSICEIQQIQVYTRTGIFIADINYANNYTNAISRHETKLEDIISNDKPHNTYGGYLEGLFPSNLGGQSINSEAIIRPAAGDANNTVAGAGFTSFLEPAYAVVGSTNGANPVIERRIALKNFKNSLLSVNNDLYFGGEILYLKIIWAPTTKVYYKTTNADNDNTDHAIATTGTITKLSLYLAIEANPVLENELKMKVASPEGLNILLPYVYVNKINLGLVGANGSHNLQVRYNRGNGSKLTKIYWAPYNNTESSYSAYDHNNLAMAKVVSFNTSINNTRTSQFEYRCAEGEDWMVKKEKLKGSCILSSNEYYHNFTWIEDFTDHNSFVSKPTFPDESTFIDGLDLSTEIIYQVNATVANVALNHYVWAVCQRNLIVNSSGISVM